MLSPRTARGNRFGLGLIGVVLLAGGLFSLGQSQGLFFSNSSHDRLLAGAESRYAAHHSWFWIAVAAAAIVVTVACARWLIVQARRGNLGTFPLENDRTHGGTRVAAGLLSHEVEDEIGGYPDVTAVRATLAGSCAAPELRLTLNTAPHADLAKLRARIDTDALPHLRQALELDELPVYVRLAFDTSSPSRIVN